MQSLYLPEGERLIVHRGASEPICPWAEVTHLTARQSVDGHAERLAGVFYGALDARGEVRLRLFDIIELAIKKNGEPNALLPGDSGLGSWWCHVVEHNGDHWGLVGRPNKRQLGPRYQIDFPHVVSTGTWRRALAELPAAAQKNMLELREEKFPLSAAAYYDFGRSALESSFLDNL